MIYLNVDLAKILDLGEELKPKIEQALKEAGKALAKQADAHIKEQVQAKLHSTRDKYVKAMDFKDVGDNTWIITLDESVMWLEEGMQEHEMLDDLLASPKAKTAKDGSRYLAVPFEHKKAPSQQTQAAHDLTTTLRTELAKRKIPYTGIETDKDGKPKLGTLHSFDILKQPLKTHEGPGQGHGAVGQVRQGTTGIPFLQGVRISQKMVGGKAQRSIATFRIASSKHKGSGKWVHPGIVAKNFFEEAERWALDKWETEVVPAILAKLGQSL